MRFVVLLLTVVVRLAAAPQPPAVTGRVVFGDKPVPGATVTAVRADRTVTSFTNDAGEFQLTGLDAGWWTIRVEMCGFVTETREMRLPLAAPLAVPLTMRVYGEIVPGSPKPPEQSSPAPDTADASIIAGSVINGAASPYAQPRAFGNNRPRGVPFYNFAAGVLLG